MFYNILNSGVCHVTYEQMSTASRSVSFHIINDTLTNVLYHISTYSDEVPVYVSYIYDAILNVYILVDVGIHAYQYRPLVGTIYSSLEEMTLACKAFHPFTR